MFFWIVVVVVVPKSKKVAKYYTYNAESDADPQVCINLQGVPEIAGVFFFQPSCLLVGAAVTLAELISSLKTYIPEGGSYFSALAYHLHHVANK
jgi:hypothetical protein